VRSAIELRRFDRAGMHHEAKMLSRRGLPPDARSLRARPGRSGTAGAQIELRAAACRSSRWHLAVGGTQQADHHEHHEAERTAPAAATSPSAAAQVSGGIVHRPCLAPR
jgi:hypothetical protein